MVFVSWASDGLRIYELNENKEIIQLEYKSSTTVKCLSIAKSSMWMGYLDQTSVVLLDVNDRSIVSTIPIEPASRIQLSPCGKFGFIYTSFKIDNENPSGSPNIFVYDMINKTKLKEYIFRRGDGWQPQWNSDSSVCSLFVNGEIHMYSNNLFSEKPYTKLSLKGIRHFSMSTSSQPNLAVYIPGEKNAKLLLTRSYVFPLDECGNTSTKNYASVACSRVPTSFISTFYPTLYLQGVVVKVKRCSYLIIDIFL
ncbi:nuclease-related [Schistosoma mansoni]|uniref:nuclease-related n=1 Tax=Schistosoma mansoni TaxID=6183 RepID=UPI0001A62A08|nr:nuclease-related [Schistosoma mansoni]|eukprot:XP_018645915.1 nuclease-related [Schistosoma mansoni]